MKINIDEWKNFKLGKIFRIENVKGNTTSDLETGVDIPYIAAQKNSNGLSQMCSIENMDEFISKGNCIVFIQIGEGSAGYSNYIPNDFIGMKGKICCGYIDGILNRKIGLFLVTILDKSRYKFSFGRSWTGERLKNSELLLPIKTNENGSAIIDAKKTFSDEGYIPDWDYMEEFIERLETRERESHGSIRDALRTKNNSEDTPKLNVKAWEEFIIKDLFKVKYGVNLELNNCLEISNGINFVSRTSENNGVSSRIEEIDNLSPQPPGLITVAGGGSVLSTFLQNEPFYSGRDLYTLESKKDISNEAKLFIITIIEQNKYKYNYGRQANRTLPYLILKLPIKRNVKNEPVIDENKTFSPKGYIPDWDFMESYIKALPYGDKI